jgi:citrate synthase
MNDAITSRESWIGAEAAATLLGVSRATLYAYVSRGHIRSQPLPGSSRQRSYSREDVERLHRRTDERRAPDKATARALQWGLPVLESSITLVDGRRLYYRGLDVITLARTRTLEDVADLIWTGQLGPVTASRPVPAMRIPATVRRLPYIARTQCLLAAAAAGDPHVFDLRPQQVTSTGARILHLVTRAATDAPASDGTSAPSRTTDVALGRTWGVSARGADILRTALVLCADHELNVSSFTARCVASAGSHPYAVVTAALGALEGPKHGGASARVEAMLASTRRARSFRAVIDARRRRGEIVEGFGHPLYADGDPRARLLLDLLVERYGRSAECRGVMAFAEAAANLLGEHPNLDFGLAAVSRVLKLPLGAPLMLFATGRTVGWIGHAIEQYETGQLIRPRARYVGPPVATG